MAIIKEPLDCVKWNVVRKWRVNVPTESERNVAQKLNIKEVETVLNLGHLDVF